MRPCWAECFSGVVYPPVLSPEFLQPYFGFLEVRGVKPLGEPAVHRCQQRIGLSALALLLPQARETHGGPQLERFRLLTDLPEEGF